MAVTLFEHEALLKEYEQAGQRANAAHSPLLPQDSRPLSVNEYVQLTTMLVEFMPGFSAESMERLRKCFFVMVDRSNGVAYARASMAYLDDPAAPSGLAAFYPDGPVTAKLPARLSHVHFKKMTVQQVSDFINLSIDFGLLTTIPIRKRSVYLSGNLRICRHQAWRAQRYHRSSHLGQDEDWVVEQLESVLSEPTVVESRCVWNSCAGIDSRMFFARYCSNGEAPLAFAPSKLVQDLARVSWIPQLAMRGMGEPHVEFHRPAHCNIEQLPEGFDTVSSEGFRRAIRFGVATGRNSPPFQSADITPWDGFPVHYTVEDEVDEILSRMRGWANEPPMEDEYRGVLRCLAALPPLLAWECAREVGDQLRVLVDFAAGHVGFLHPSAVLVDSPVKATGLSEWYRLVGRGAIGRSLRPMSARHATLLTPIEIDAVLGALSSAGIWVKPRLK